MKATVQACARPLLAALVLSLSLQILAPGLAMVSYLSLPLFTFWAGWCVGQSPAGNAWRALLAGVLLLLLVFFLVPGLAATMDADRLGQLADVELDGWLAQRPLLAWWFMLALTSLVLLPVAGLIALLGGALARRRANAKPTV